MKRTKIFELSALTEADIAFIAEAVSKGAVAVLPTDTVYGLAVSAAAEFLPFLNEAKNNPSEKPAQILCLKEQSVLLAQNGAGLKTALAFWPRPLTAVLPASAEGEVLSGRPTVGLRVPAEGLSAELMRRTGRPLYASSANLHSLPTLEREEDILSVFTGRADIIVKGGFLKAVPSAVVDFTVFPPKIIREGSLRAGDLEILLNKLS